MMKLTALFLLFLPAFQDSASVKKDEEPRTTKLAMDPLKMIVGTWDATGMPDEGMKGESWTEKVEWGYLIKKDVYALSVSFGEGKFFKTAQLDYDLKKKTYRLTTTTLKSTKQIFEGPLELSGIKTEKFPVKLTLTQITDKKDVPLHRITLDLLHANRYLLTFEQRATGKKSWVRVCVYGNRPKGRPFLKGKIEKECIITGAYAGEEVIYKGRSYPICCSGCRKTFLEDPEAALKTARDEGWLKD